MVETFDCTNIEIKQGDVGAEVTLLQKHLKTLGYYTTYNGSYLKIDGIFGTYTDWALKKFQKDTGHDDDGVFGPKTCPDLNKKILAKNGITSQNVATSTTTNSTLIATTNSKYKINVANNVFKSSESNININGLYFIISKLTRTNELHSPEWNTIEMMDGSDYDYPGKVNYLRYSFEVYMTRKQYATIRPELEKLGYDVCTVSTKLFPSGKYSVKVTPTDEDVDAIKITIDLKEYKA